MSNSKSGAVRVKKVRPYPIPATISGGEKPLSGNLIKLTQMGFLIEVGANFMKVGEKYQVAFDIPMANWNVHEGVVVVKSYNQFGGAVGAAAGGSLVRVLEMHFRSLSSASKEHIVDFLTKIKQPLT